MPYPEQLVAPMRAELTSIGVKELKSAAEVDAFMAEKKGSAMIIVNSVCGCAAGGCRPAVKLALQNSVKPDRVATVFAGQADGRDHGPRADDVPSGQLPCARQAHG